MMHRLFITVMCALVVGCGQKGDLYLNPSDLDAPLLQSIGETLEESNLELPGDSSSDELPSDDDEDDPKKPRVSGETQP